MRVCVATSNAGKLREFEQLLGGAPLELALDPGYQPPPEGDVSYADNAALKARALHARLVDSGRPCAVLADDSGLEVTALGGRPGVLTALYGGADLPWETRRLRLVAELETTGGGRDRRARFVCALHFVDAAGREFATMATVDGTIALEDRGTQGFSFDPLFVYPPAQRTFAEMTPAQKNAVSHRAIAVAGLVAALERAGIIA